MATLMNADARELQKAQADAASGNHHHQNQDGQIYAG